MNTIALRNEKELLVKIAGGCELAFKEIFIHYWPAVYSVALQFTKSKEISQDLTQDVFTKIWIKRHFLGEVNKLESFLFITARNLILDRLRQRVFTREYEPILHQHFVDTALIPSGKVELKEMEEIIIHGVHQLPRQQQVAFYLSRYAGLRHEEIAVQMGITKQSVKSHVVRAMSALKKYVASQSIRIVLFVTYLLER